MSIEVNADHKAEIDRHFTWLEQRLPAGPARYVNWLRRPSSKLVRIPLSLLLMVGGVFSILPVLGLWMLPLGMLLIAQDVPVLENPSHDRWDGLSANGRNVSARSSSKRTRQEHRPRDEITMR